MAKRQRIALTDEEHAERSLQLAAKEHVEAEEQIRRRVRDNASGEAAGGHGHAVAQR